MRCTIVIPCHNEESNIEPMYREIIRVMGTSDDYAILFVDDGSKDGTLDKIRNLRASDGRVWYLSFVRNYGHQAALLAGLREVKTGVAVTLDGDLQHPPRYIPIFLEQMAKTRADVVLGRRTAPQKGMLKHFFSEAYKRCFSLLTGLHVPQGTSDFNLYSRRALDIICSLREPEPYLRGSLASLRLPTTIVDYDLHERASGSASYSFRKSLRMGLNSVWRYSKVPYRLGLLLGGAGVFLGTAQAVHYMYLRLFTDKLVPGQADLMVLLGLTGSLILVMLSLLYRLLTDIRSCLVKEPPFIIAEKNVDATNLANGESGG